MRGRGQTIHDYLLGIVVVLLTIAGVFAFFPDVFVPFQDPVGDDDQYMSDRLADELLDAQAAVGSDRTVNLTKLDRALRNGTKLGAFVNRSGIPDWKHVNVTVRDRTGILLRSETDDVGTVYRTERSDPPATTVRVIQGRDGGDCAESCRLIVRVWEGE